MNTLFSIIGKAASVLRPLSKKKMGPISMDLALLIGAGITVTTLFVASDNLSQHQSIAEKMSVGQALSSNSMGRFVMMDGILYPKPMFEQAADEHKEFVPFVDEQSNKVILVYRGTPKDSRLPGFDVVHGTIVPLPNAVAESLKSQGNRVDGYEVDSTKMLSTEVEPTPNNYIPAMLRMFALSLFALLIPFAAAFASRNEVFRPDTAATGMMPDSANPVSGIESIRAHGVLAANEILSLDFDGADCKAQSLPTGEVALFTEHFGETYGVLFLPTTLKVNQTGKLYTGNAVIPAVRLNFHNIINNRRGNLTLTFSSESDRAAFIGEMSRMARDGRMAA